MKKNEKENGCYTFCHVILFSFRDNNLQNCTRGEAEHGSPNTISTNKVDLISYIFEIILLEDSTEIRTNTIYNHVIIIILTFTMKYTNSTDKLSKSPRFFKKQSLFKILII